MPRAHLRVAAPAERARRPRHTPRSGPRDCTLPGCGRPGVYAVTPPTGPDPLQYACRYHLVRIVDGIRPMDLPVVIDRLAVP